MTAPLLLTVFPTFAVGGAQARFTALANHLGSSWRHAIVAMDGNLASRERLDPGLEVRFPSLQVRKGDTAGNIRRFRAALGVLRPDTLLTHNFGSIEWTMANAFGRVRQVHVEDGFGPEERSGQLPRRVWLRRVFLRGRTVALPSATLMRIASDTWQLSPKWLRYIPNGIDLARFEGAVAAPAWPAEGPVVGTVAGLRPEKNIARLLRAFRLATDGLPAILVVVGDGPERGALQRLATELGIGERVYWMGQLADPAPVLKAFDVFALSSDTEQMPLSLLEAMAAGLPTAATDVGDVRMMLPEPGRRFVTAPDDGALAGSLRGLLADPALRRELGAQSRAKAAAEFDQRRMFAAWGCVLEGREPPG